MRPASLACLALASALSLAAPDRARADIRIEHRPVYAVGGQYTYRATAESPLGIEDIGIGFVAHRLACADGVPTLEEEVDEGFVGESSGPNPPTSRTLVEEFGPFPLNTWITVSASAGLPNGTRLSHLYHQTANLTGDTLACLGAAPIYIGGNGTDARSNFNVLFVATDDFKTGAEYLATVGDILFDYPDVGTPSGEVGLLDDRQYGAFKDRFNFFLNEFAFKGKIGCDDDAQWAFPANNPRAKLAVLDVFLLTHQPAPQDRDCGTATQPSKTGFVGWGSASLPAIAAHELGHMLGGLLDEYFSCDDCGDQALGPHPNIFPTEQACRDHVSAEHPFGEPDACRTFPNQERYRWCPNGDVMDMNIDLSRPDEGEEFSQFAALISMLPAAGEPPQGPILSLPPPLPSLPRQINAHFRRTFRGRSLRVRLESTRSGSIAVQDVALVRGTVRMPQSVNVPAVCDPAVPPLPTLEVRLNDARGRTFFHYFAPDGRDTGPAPPPPPGTRTRSTDVVPVDFWDIVIPWRGEIRRRAASFQLVEDTGAVLVDVRLPPSTR